MAVRPVSSKRRKNIRHSCVVNLGPVSIARKYCNVKIATIIGVRFLGEYKQRFEISDHMDAVVHYQKKIKNNNWMIQKRIICHDDNAGHVLVIFGITKIKETTAN